MMIWTAWHNGSPQPSGAGYGLKITAEDRDRHVDRTWQTIIVELRGLRRSRGVNRREIVTPDRRRILPPVIRGA